MNVSSGFLPLISQVFPLGNWVHLSRLFCITKGGSSALFLGSFGQWELFLLCRASSHRGNQRRSRGTPSPRRRHKLRRLFPVCITVLWVIGSYTDRQLLQYIADRAVIQTGKVVLIDVCLCFYKDISSLRGFNASTYVLHRCISQKISLSIKSENDQCYQSQLKTIWIWFLHKVKYSTKKTKF